MVFSIYLSQFGFRKLVTSGLARGWHPGRMYPWIVVFWVIVRRWHTIILAIFSSDEWQNVYNYGTVMSQKYIRVHRKNFTGLFRGVFHMAVSISSEKWNSKKSFIFGLLRANWSKTPTKANRSILLGYFKT